MHRRQAQGQGVPRSCCEMSKKVVFCRDRFLHQLLRVVKQYTLQDVRLGIAQAVSGSDEPVGFPSGSRTTTPPSTSVGKGPLHRSTVLDTHNA